MSERQFHDSPQTYLTEVRTGVPDYDDLQSAVAAAVAAVRPNRALDLGVGTGETSRQVLLRQPDVRIIALDASLDMVNVANDALPAVDVRPGRLEDPLPGGAFDAVFTALAVHHLPGAAKLELFRRIAASLTAGGRFVLGDVVVPTEPVSHPTPIDPAIDFPEPLDRLVKWLREAGLRSEVIWSANDLAVVVADKLPSARRPPAAAARSCPDGDVSGTDVERVPE